MFELHAYEKEIVTVVRERFVRGTIGAKVKISFSEYWNDFTKTVVFKFNDCESEPIRVLAYNEEATITIPWEVLAECGSFVIGLFGTKEGERYPTLYSEDFAVEYGTDTHGGAPTPPPTPSELEQLEKTVDTHTTEIEGLGNRVENIENLIPEAATVDNQLADKEYVDSGLAEKYEKPANGIPKSDLADAVKSSLEKADTSYIIIDIGDQYFSEYNEEFPEISFESISAIQQAINSYGHIRLKWMHPSSQDCYFEILEYSDYNYSFSILCAKKYIVNYSFQFGTHTVRPIKQGYRLIRDFTNPSLSGIGIITDENGESFALSEFLIFINRPADGGGSAPVSMFLKYGNETSWTANPVLAIPNAPFTEKRDYIVKGAIDGMLHIDLANQSSAENQFSPWIAATYGTNLSTIITQPITAFRFNRYVASELPQGTRILIYGVDA